MASFWGFKIVGYVLAVVIAFLIPNEFFVFWGNYITVVGAALFILIQLLLLIDFTHSFSEYLLLKWEETEDRWWMMALIAASFGMLLLACVLDGIAYAYFSATQLNQFFITFNLILCIVVLITSIHPNVQEVNPRSGLIQSGIVIVYSTYLVVSAIVSEPDTLASPTKATTSVVGAIFTFLAIAYSTSRTALKHGELIGDESAAEMRQNALTAAVESG